MKTITNLSLVILILFTSFGLPTQTKAQVGGPQPTQCSDSAGGPVECTPTSTSTATPTPTNTPLPKAAPPTSTPTPFPFRLDDPLYDPVIPTKPVFGYPSLTPTPFPQAIPPLPDLFVTDMEVTQGIQDLNNRMPLVGGRRTVVRVYMGTDGGNLANVKGMLVAYINGQQAGQPIYADNQAIIAKQDGGERINLDDSLYFYVPYSWRQPDTNVTFKVFVYSGDPSTPFALEEDAENNFGEVSVHFDNTTAFYLNLVTMHNHEYDDLGLTKGSPHDYFYFPWQGPEITNDLYRYLPLDDLNVVAQGYVIPVDTVLGIPVEFSPGNHGVHDNDWNLYSFFAGDNDQNWYSEIFTFALYRMESVGDGIDIYNWYGMIDPALPISFQTKNNTLFNAGGVAKFGVAIGKMNPNFSADSPWRISGGITLVHEMTHNLGFNHYLCAGNEDLGGAIDPYPYLNPCRIAAIDPEGYYGFDVYYDMWSHLSQPTVISNDPAEAEPNQGFPVMGYLSPQWMDAYSWCLILDQWGIPCDPPSIGIAALPEDQLAALDPSTLYETDHTPRFQVGERGIFVSGILDREALTAAFSAVYITDEAARLESLLGGHQHEDFETEEGFNLALLGADGSVLHSVELNDYDLGLHEPVIPVHIPFMTLIPLIENGSTLQLRAGETVLAEHPLSNNPPEVTLLSPNGGEVFENSIEVRWEGSDPDGDELSYMVRYSHDGGASWNLLVFGLRGNAAIIDIPPGMPGGDNVLVEVVALDGTHRSADQSDAPLSLPNQAPQAYIQAPAYHAQFPTNGMVHFIGAASDPEDGTLDDGGLVWSSNVDGELGVGPELQTHTLSPGEHEITLTVVDSQGVSGSSTVLIFVDPDVVRAVPTQEEIDEVNDILNGIFPVVETDAGEQPAPTQPVAADEPAQLPATLLLVGGLALVLLVVLFLFLRGRRAN